MLTRLRYILEMIRFSHTLFALPFALLAAMMAWRLRALEQASDPFTLIHDSYVTVGSWTVRLPWVWTDQPLLAIRWQELLGILLSMVTARSAAMAFNRLADWRIDAQNPRTAGRHIPAGLLSVASVTTFALAMSLGFVASTLLFLPNRLPLYFSLPVLGVLFGYSYTKRFTALAHFWLGLALALAPVCAWIALRGEIVMQTPADLLPAVLLGLAVLLWVAGFDIIYACQDHEFDGQAGLRSVPVRLGVVGALRLAAVCHLGMLVLLALLPAVFPPLGTLYLVGIAAVAALLVYEHLLVRPDDLTRVNVAFFYVNAVVSVGLLVVGAVDLLV